MRVFIYGDAGHLIHYFHALKPFRMTTGRFRIGMYTIREVPSLKKHRDPSSVLVILVLSLPNTSKWSKSVLIEYLYMLTYCWAVGGAQMWAHLLVAFNGICYQG